MNGKQRIPGRDWRQIVEEQRGGGQSVRSYCEEHGISEALFYTWRRRLNNDSEGAVQFALVASGGSGGALPVLQLQLRTGERLEILPGADAVTLRTVLTVLRESA
jgi:transposase-like protein